ncbi:MAG: hypothetical protein Tsb0018_04820 [Opitutales bacterium]
MDSLGPQFIRTQQPAGTSIQSLSSGKDPANHLARAQTQPEQLCLYRPDKNAHVATGITRANFSSVKQASERLLDSKPILQDERPALDKAYRNAQNIVRHAGVNLHNLSPRQAILLGSMLGEGIISTDWAQRMNEALSKGHIDTKAFNDILDNQIEAYKTAEAVIADATNHAQAFTAGEIKTLANLLLQEIIDKTWVDNHATAIDAGALSHRDLANAVESAIDIHHENIAETAKSSSKDKVSQEKSSILVDTAKQQAALQQLSGLHNFSSSWHATVAKEVAKEVISPDGKVDIEKATLMRDELNSKAYRENAPQSPHNKRMIQYLDALIQNENGLRDLLESISAPPNQSSKAADKIRATLELPPDTEVTASHARQAGLSALLSEIRQHDYVGSCFATSVAIKAHDGDPIRFLREIKELIQNDSLTVSNERANVEVPIATSVNITALRRPITIEIDTKKTPPAPYLMAVGKNELLQSMPLASIPGLQAAMNVLGIPEGERDNILLDIAQGLGKKTTIEGILKALVDTQGLKNAEHKLTQAIDAFQGEESNPMLRAWEYTLAGYAGTSITGHHINQLQGAIISTPVPGSKDKLLDGTLKVLQSNNSGNTSPNDLRKVNLALRKRFQKVAEGLLQAEFHAMSSEQARTSESGWQLYYAKNGEKISIKTDEDMQEFLMFAWETTLDQEITERGADHRSFADQKIARNLPKEQLMSYMEKILKTPGFMDSVAKTAQQYSSEIHRDPQWFFTSGADQRQTLDGYYGRISSQNSYYDILPPPAENPKKFFGQFATHIQQLKTSTGRIPEHITCGVSEGTNGHALVIKPLDDPKLQEIIESNNPEEKVDEILLKPGKKLAETSLSEEEIRDVVRNISAKMSGPEHANQFDELMPDIMEDLKASNYTGTPKELRETLGRLFNGYIE